MSILEVNGLKKVYSTRFGGNKVEALKNVNFSVSEGEYVAIMGESGSGKTTLLIAHRISTVEGLDKIIFLEDGKVEAVGPHDRLYASCPEYRKMVDLQKLEDEVGGGNA